MGAIQVMWKRQIIRFTRAKTRIAISFFQPIFFLLAFGFGFNSVYQAAGEGSYIMFLAPGIIAMAILFGSIMNGIETIWDKQFGFLKETLVAPVPRWKIMLGRTLGGATVALFQGLFIMLITFVIGFKIYSWTYFLIGALFVMFLFALFFNAMGIAIASKFEDMSAFPMVMNLLVMPMFFLSGALYSLDGLPVLMQNILYLNPAIYGVDAIRGLLSGTFIIGFGIDIIVMVVLTLLMIIIGAKSFSSIEV